MKRGVTWFIQTPSSLSHQTESRVTDIWDKSAETRPRRVFYQRDEGIGYCCSAWRKCRPCQRMLALAVKICWLVCSTHINLTRGGQWPWRQKQFHIPRPPTGGQRRGWRERVNTLRMNRVDRCPAALLLGTKLKCICLTSVMRCSLVNY